MTPTPDTAAPDASTPADVGIAGAVLMTAVSGYIDAYLFLHHGVFAFAQTGNVIFLTVAVAQGHAWTGYLWPLLAYIGGLILAQVLRRFAPSLPTGAVAGVFIGQIVVFAAIALVPASAPAAAFVVPLAVVGGIRLQLFRAAGGVSFVSIATTGNLMRVVDAIATAVRAPSRQHARAMAFTVIVVVGFVLGAFAGAAASGLFGAPALWGAVVLECVAFAVYLGTHRKAATTHA
jgi:uncharacterized membrane protein YoaK (UPF0700 family)